jgi:F0F1-type ATP synthase assembly protein I
MKYLGIGTEIISCILIGLFMGLALDQIFDKKPLFLIIMLLFGVAAAGLKVYRIIKDSKNFFVDD